MWVDKCGYILTQWHNFKINSLPRGSKTWGEKIILKVGKISAENTS